MSFWPALRQMMNLLMQSMSIVRDSFEWVVVCGDSPFVVESTDGTIQIRPFKEFVPSKGRDRLLSLKHFYRPAPALDKATDLHSSDKNSNSSRPNNAYDFMRSRRDPVGDPSVARWNASIRLNNFASVETSPLCVCWVFSYPGHQLTSYLYIDGRNRGSPRPHCARTSPRWFRRRWNRRSGHQRHRDYCIVGLSTFFWFKVLTDKTVEIKPCRSMQTPCCSFA